jgi:hypothetical protein
MFILLLLLSFSLAIPQDPSLTTTNVALPADAVPSPNPSKSFFRRQDPFVKATFCWKRSKFRKLSPRISRPSPRISRSSRTSPHTPPHTSNTSPDKSNKMQEISSRPRGWRQSFGLPPQRHFQPCNGTSLGPICLQTCPLLFPIPCGLGCTTTKEACKTDKLNKLTSIATVAFNIGVSAHLAAGISHSMTKLAITHDELVLAGKGVKEAAEMALVISIQEFLKTKLGPVMAAKIAQTLATDAFGEEAVDWTVRVIVLMIGCRSDGGCCCR